MPLVLTTTYLPSADFLACSGETRGAEVKGYPWPAHAWSTKQIQNIHLIKDADWWFMLQGEMATPGLVSAFKEVPFLLSSLQHPIYFSALEQLEFGVFVMSMASTERTIDYNLRY